MRFLLVSLPWICLSLVNLTGCESHSPRSTTTPSQTQRSSTAQPAAATKQTQKSPLAPTYAPGNREEFVFVERAKADQAKGYERLCQDSQGQQCPTLNYQRYLGARGYFETPQPESVVNGMRYYPVMLQSGERLYYQVPERQLGKYRGTPPIARFHEFSQEPDLWAETLVPGSPVRLQGMEIYEGAPVYRLSDGGQIGEAKLGLVRELAPLFGADSVAAAELLVDLDVRKDVAHQRFFITPIGNPLRSEYRLYLAIDSQQREWRLRVQYYARDWLFVQQFAVVTQGQQWESPTVEFKRDHAAGFGWEWVDVHAGSDELEQAQRLSEADDATVTFKGLRRDMDYALASDQKLGLAQMLRLKALLDGTAD